MEVASLPLPHSITWTRKSSSREESQSQSEDAASELQQQQSEETEVDKILIRLPAESLGEMILSKKLHSFVKSVRTSYPGKSAIYLLESMDLFLRDQKRQTDRAFKSGLNSNKEPIGVGLSKQDLDKVLVWLQVEGKVHIRETNSTIESADYIWRLTSAISTSPYKYFSKKVPL